MIGKLFTPTIKTKLQQVDTFIFRAMRKLVLSAYLTKELLCKRM